MHERVVIFGPGRVGAAFGRRLREAGWDLLGFVGVEPASVDEALAFAGAGKGLPPGAHAEAEVVVFAVGDADLEGAIVQALVAARPRSGSLWLHTSGAHDLSPFAGLDGSSVHRGSLHPVSPFADRESGYRAMQGQPAVIDGDAEALPRLEALVGALSMRCVRAEGGDRALYHTACALAANGLVALRALVDETLAASGGLAGEDAAQVVDALMRRTLHEVGDRGVVAALSGPVRRGDAATLGRHLAALSAAVPDAAPTYRALMLVALQLARRAGLSGDRAAEVDSVLRGRQDGD